MMARLTQLTSARSSVPSVGLRAARRELPTPSSRALAQYPPHGPGCSAWACRRPAFLPERSCSHGARVLAATLLQWRSGPAGLQGAWAAGGHRAAPRCLAAHLGLAGGFVFVRGCTRDHIFTVPLDKRHPAFLGQQTSAPRASRSPAPRPQGACAGWAPTGPPASALGHGPRLPLGGVKARAGATWEGARSSAGHRAHRCGAHHLGRW